MLKENAIDNKQETDSQKSVLAKRGTSNHDKIQFSVKVHGYVKSPKHIKWTQSKLWIK